MNTGFYKIILKLYFVKMKKEEIKESLVEILTTV